MRFKRKLEYFLKHNPQIFSILRFGGSAIFKLVSLFVRTQDNLILFSSFSGKRYNDSPKKIYEYLQTHEEGNGLRYIWAFEHPEEFDLPGCEKIKIDTWAYFITCMRAKYWVTSVNIERGFKFKKKNQVYLNTWHGSAINWVGNAVDGRKDFNWDHINYFCISGDYEAGCTCKDFNVRPEALLKSGLPRNDDLYNVTQDEIDVLKRKMGLPLDKKILLYAPTWRESKDKGQSCDIRPPMNLDHWLERLGDDFIILIRAHENTTDVLGVEFGDRIRNLSNYPVVNDVMKVSDYLVSDYSAIQLDYCILERPIASFGYDYEEYSKIRGFYFDLDKEIPSGICHTEDEVLDYFLNNPYETLCEETRTFKKNHMQFGGHATEICVAKLLGLAEITQ